MGRTKTGNLVAGVAKRGFAEDHPGLVAGQNIRGQAGITAERGQTVQGFLKQVLEFSDLGILLVHIQAPIRAVSMRVVAS